MIDLNLIGSRIKKLRQQRGLTQSEFAEKLSVSFQAVSNWERGITPPDIENLIRISSYFGILVDTLLSPISDELYLGIDGGGTKTEFVVASLDGQVLKQIVKTGSNPNDIGFPGTEELICSGIEEVLREFPTVKAIFCGIAGITAGNYRDKLYALIKKRYPAVIIGTGSDALNLFSLRDGAELAVISGTGSVVFAKKEEQFQRIGGWGYLFDRAGSAYDIGRDAICLALQEEDCHTALCYMTKLLREKMNVSKVWEHINSLYKGGKAYIAQFASVVFEAYLAGDEAAIKIIDQNAKALAELLNTGKRVYKTNSIAVASGGLFEHYPDIMAKHISKYTDVKLVISELPPIYGAVRQALGLAEAMPQSEFYDNFKRTYGEIKK